MARFARVLAPSIRSHGVSGTQSLFAAAGAERGNHRARFADAIPNLMLSEPSPMSCHGVLEGMLEPSRMCRSQHRELTAARESTWHKSFCMAWAAGRGAALAEKPFRFRRTLGYNAAAHGGAVHVDRPSGPDRENPGAAGRAHRRGRGL